MVASVKTIDAAIAEAERFIIRARKAKETSLDQGEFGSWSGKDNAAMRRASMDLTRALVQVRR